MNFYIASNIGNTFISGNARHCRSLLGTVTVNIKREDGKEEEETEEKEKEEKNNSLMSMSMVPRNLDAPVKCQN